MEKDLIIFPQLFLPDKLQITLQYKDYTDRWDSSTTNIQILPQLIMWSQLFETRVNSNGLKAITVFAKKLHPRYWTKS